MWFFSFSIWFAILCQTYHGAKWDGSWGMVIDSNEVDKEGCPTDHCWDQKGPSEHLLNPPSACYIKKKKLTMHYRREYMTLTNCRKGLFRITSLFCIQASPKVAIYRRGGSIHKNSCTQHGSSPVKEKKKKKKKMQWGEPQQVCVWEFNDFRFKSRRCSENWSLAFPQRGKGTWAST